MKILVLSDTQIGSGRNLAAERLADQEAVLVQIGDLADEEGAELLLHCGDLFDSRTPTDEARMVAKRFFKRVSAERDVIAIAGNHCLRNATLPSAVDLYDGIDFVREPRVIQTRAGAIACLPWAPPGRYLASRNGSSREQLNAEIAQLVVDVARGLREQIDGHAILAGHWMVSGGSLPNGLPLFMLSGPVLPLSDLEELGFDLCVFGDVHVPERLGNGSVISVGSPWLNDWGEEHIEHGVWLIDTDKEDDTANGDGTAHVEYHPLEDRRFVTVNVDLTKDSADGRADSDSREEGPCSPTPGERGSADQRPGMGARTPGALSLDETDRIAAAIAEHFPLTDASVRLRYTGTREQARTIDVAALRTLCEDAGVHKLLIEASVVREDRARVEGLTEALTVPEALDLYLASEDSKFTESRAKQLRVLTAELLAEVEA